MGHACQILTFETDDKRKIQAECDEWGDYNCDPYERGGFGGGLGSGIKFTSNVFNDYEQAANYLDGTFGRYDQTAVRYWKYPKRTQTETEKKLAERVQKTYKAYSELSNKAHYSGVKSQYIACPHCGSRLATEYCGKTWNNNCPVCKKEMRPQTTLDRIASLKKSWEDAQKQLKDEQKKNDEKNKKNAKLCWAVACEVHC